MDEPWWKCFNLLIILVVRLFWNPSTLAVVRDEKVRSGIRQELLP
jgi:hypothetical protein